MKIFLFLVLGLFFGFFAGYNSCNKSVQDQFYIRLAGDSCIDKIGTIKKGTLVKFDQAFSEGFSRYILYLNIPSNIPGERYESERENEIIPYWLSPLDSTCASTN